MGSKKTAALKAALGLLAIQVPMTGIAATNVLVGANFTLVASVEGGPLSFQWRKNGADIPGATEQSLAIASATASDAGAYQVVAANSAGSAASSEEFITVSTSESAVLPSIITQPVATQTVSVGESLTFSVVAAGVPAPSFQWQKNGTSLPGATNSVLVISPVALSDAGTYVVVVSNVAGTVASRGSVVTVSDPAATSVPPTIIAQPAPSQTVPAGNPVNFSVSVAGTPTPSVQWKKDGAPISGATSSTLTINSTALADAGTYVAVASNSAGSISSANAVLSVTETIAGAAPKITNQPASQTVVAGTSAEFAVAASGIPSPTYQWKKNGSNISGATNSTLRFTAVSSADAGSYTVVATNSSGAVQSDAAMLYVQSAPVFTAQPVAQAVTAGSTAKFTAVVSAVPGATYQWKKDGNSISGATASILQISGVSSADEGLYKLVATNALGSTTSNEVALILGSAPTISSQPQSQTVATKANVTFTVSANGSPAPTYQWKKNGVAITGETKASLTIKSVNKPDAGEYFVEVRNAIGWVLSNRVTLGVTGANGRTSSEEEPVIAVGGDASASGLVNLSVRANAGTGSNGLIVGFVIDGAASKSVLIRGVGPTLQDFGVTGVLRDPQLALYSGATITASNDDWAANENALQIVGTSARVGAFGLAERASDSALMTTLAHGAYTVQLSGKESSTGVALVEVYDATASATTKLVNLSVRTYIGSGSESPNVGFVIAGTSPRKLLIRAIGPTLGAFGVNDAISDPQVELFRGDVRLEQNDNWGGSNAIGATFAQVGAFGLSDATSKDAVLLTTLDPGAYTVVVTGANGSKGIGLVEVYDVP